MARTVADAIEKLQSTQGLEVDCKKLKILIEKDPAFRLPPDQALSTVDPSPLIARSLRSSTRSTSGAGRS